MSRELLPSIRLFRIGEIWDKFQRPSYAGIRGEKGFDRSRRNPNKIFPANVYPGPCFNSNYPTQLRPRNFFPTIPPSPSLSLFLYLLSLRDGESEVWNSNTGKVSAKNNVVPVVSWAKFHGGNSWYSFATWLSLLLFIGYWTLTEFSGNNRRESRRQPFFLVHPLPFSPLILSFGGKGEVWRRYRNLGYRGNFVTSLGV